MGFPKGKIASNIGSDGAGESPLLSIVSRLLPQDEGRMLVNNKVNSEYKNSDLAKHLSILKQFNNIDVKLTVRELVSFGRFPYSQGRLNSEDHQKIDEAIEFLDLEEIENSYIDQLSGGQRQRALLAVVVSQDTEYILLDAHSYN